jgi:hypothetical protein
VELATTLGSNTPKCINAESVGYRRALANAFSVGKHIAGVPQGCRKLHPGLELANAFGVQITRLRGNGLRDYAVTQLS